MSTLPETSQKSRFSAIVERIAQAGTATETSPQKARLIAVSKGQTEATIKEVIALGQICFGENRVQEAEDKWVGLKQANPSLELHLIGPLQTNKVKEAVVLFDCIHTIDREKLALALATEMGKQGRRLPCLIQVNTGNEPQKAGVRPEKADGLIAYCKELGLQIDGLMCIPPAGENPAPHFALLHTIAKRNALPQLSMGMSDDFETAIRLGATYVRIGRALFSALDAD